MGSLLPTLLSRMPDSLKRQALVQFFRSTAAAFRCEMPRLSGLSREECLLEYARFTADRAEEALRCGEDLAGLQERLYRNVYRVGRIPGRWPGVHSVDDVMTLGRLLYGVLDIEFRGDGSGEVTIDRCYFSTFYTPEVCRVMSAMDRGLLAGLAGSASQAGGANQPGGAGLAGGGELLFSQRITEGHACCRARFTPAAGGWGA